MGSPFAMKHRRNPMSMALHSSLAPCEMPAVESLRDLATKVGHLKKLSGKGILTSGTWRDRFCLLVKSKLYFYESEDSTGSEKSCGFVNLEYFDTCTEASTRMARKTTNVFVIGSSDKGFFESHSGRHYFAAETLPEMKEWVNAINSAMKNHLRTKEKRSPSLTPGHNKKDSAGKQKSKDDETNGTLPRSSVRLDHVTKDRVRGPQGRRLPRKPQKECNNGNESKADSLIDSDEDTIVRDSLGRTTSLSALESSSETHPKISDEKEEKRNRSLNRSDIGTVEIWDTSIRDHGMASVAGTETPDIDLIYDYTSSEESEEEQQTNNNNVPPKPQNATGYLQKRPQSRTGSRLRNSSVTPPPCILRKYRRDLENGNSNGPSNKGSKTTEFTIRDQIPGPSREESPSPLLPDFDRQYPQRASSGSSLSTLTADTYSQIGNFNGNFGPFSSLRKNKSQVVVGGGNGLGPGNAKGSNSRGVGFQRQASSANASPLLNGSTANGYHGHGHLNSALMAHPTFQRNGYSSHNSSPGNTFDRNSFISNSGLNGNNSQIERNLTALAKELESATQDMKQLDVDVTGIRQDVGFVQENIVTVRSAVDITRDRVNKLQIQITNAERQVASILQEASTIRDEAAEILESAKHAKQVQENLLEEAQNLVGFLRNSSNSIPTSPYMFQHPYGHYQHQPNSCCSSSPVPPFCGLPAQQSPAKLSLSRRHTKTPERSLGAATERDDGEMQTLNEMPTNQHNNGYFDSLTLKTRKTKSIQSNGSSGSNSSASNRTSVIDPLERKPRSKSPINNDKNTNDNSFKISHL